MIRKNTTNWCCNEPSSFPCTNMRFTEPNATGNWLPREFANLVLHFCAFCACLLSMRENCTSQRSECPFGLRPRLLVCAPRWRQPPPLKRPHNVRTTLGSLKKDLLAMPAFACSIHCSYAETNHPYPCISFLTLTSKEGCNKDCWCGTLMVVTLIQTSIEFNQKLGFPSGSPRHQNQKKSLNCAI